jgi:uncharacterized membrane protein YhhN
LGVVLTLPIVSHAATLSDMVNNLAKNLQALGGGLAIIGFVVAGIMYITATANPGNMSVAKGSLVAAIVGVVILILAPVAQEFVNGLFFK